MASKIAGFFRRLSASERGDSAPQALGAAVEYNGYAIQPTARREGSHWLTAGVISKEFPDGVKEHHFIRAETHPSKDGAREFAIVKAKQIIDERGDRLFEEHSAHASPDA